MSAEIDVESMPVTTQLASSESHPSSKPSWKSEFITIRKTRSFRFGKLLQRGSGEREIGTVSMFLLHIGIPSGSHHGGKAKCDENMRIEYKVLAKAGASPEFLDLSPEKVHAYQQIR
jgi:hypothetical protein